MRRAGILVIFAACTAVICALPVAAESTGEVVVPQQVGPNPPPPEESDQGYRPPWADPYAKPPEPGIEGDPTPFNPSDVDGKSIFDDN